MIDQHHQPGSERIENGSRGQVIDITDDGEVLIQFDVTGPCEPSPARSSRPAARVRPATSTARKARPSPAPSS